MAIIAKVGHVSIYISSTRRAMAKRKAPADSRFRISLNTPRNGNLIVGAAAAWMN